MNFGRNGALKDFKKHLIIMCVAMAAIVILAVFTDIFRGQQPGSVLKFVFFLGGLALLAAVLAVLSKVIQIFTVLNQAATKIENIVNTLEKHRGVLTQISQNTHLSETAKSVAFREADTQALRETVFDKLHQQDFEATYKIIADILRLEDYKGLAEQLRDEADKYRDATDVGRANQIIAHIEKLFEGHQWLKASEQIERLIEAYPDLESAKAMRQKLLNKKDERKKILLTAWDDAVKRQATDRSLEILKELDQYLTPNEGLALQEAASGVFRTKLHNLGVQFSMAVSASQWEKAIEAGKQIIRDFPNSKMALEIRERMQHLKQKLKEQQ